MELLNQAYYIYFKEQRYYFNFLLRAFKDKVKEEILEHENINFSEKTIERLEDLQLDLTLYNIDKLPDLIDVSSTDYNRQTIAFAENNYPNVIFNSQNSVEIYDTIFDSKNVRDFINDYMANFIRSLNLSIPHYKSIEDRIKKKIQRE